ncbi:hypothetical protein PFICI_03825 [Pestalotiopsis fici W106-1]|uniref:Heterokaryon incompatibility domain-containing protein n=1 Tax=Pestalotiopsis fici (strain W106-1 / CGMCC3.15140) TaxID=1229662 RepID=W3XIF5_PESFW|nr:uncharacterized protein PFICI_03825 [Pestalotiopsis fici W106-1]ETS85800.1 hypothetical protein PFICI_03825 [Pestalotiopsis fici W106-1]
MASIYTALDISNYEIRIITIHPGDDDTIISCTLHKQSLLAEQEYTALSYCWGDPTVTDHIIVNGERAAVTINLRDALLQLRNIGVERVWADALCINQEDIQERSLQVRHMAQVYARAVRTYAWLGKEGSDHAMASLIFLRQIMSAGIEIDGIEHMHMSEVDTGIDLDVASACPSCLAKASFQDLKDLFCREYWRRRWVIQEIVAARRVQVICSRESIDLGDLMDALESCKKSKQWSPDLISCCKYLQQIIDIRLQYQSGRPQTLCESMAITQHFLSSDSRDKVFALIGITSDGGRLVPTPSYYQDFETMLTDLAAAVFREHRNFNMMVLDRRNRAATPGLPTWVPDLPVEDPKDLSSILHTELLDSRLLERSLSGPPGTLRVQGVIVGVIVATSSVLKNVPLGISTAEVSSNDTISTATPLTQPQEYYGSSSKTLRVILAMLSLPIEDAYMNNERSQLMTQSAISSQPARVD